MRILFALQRALLALSLSVAAVAASAGSVFVTGHDPIWHAGNGGNNAPGATNLARIGIDYARNGSALPFLFIESKTTPESSTSPSTPLT